MAYEKGDWALFLSLVDHLKGRGNRHTVQEVRTAFAYWVAGIMLTVLLTYLLLRAIHIHITINF